MIKGVNRQVVEVSQPESIYFERVLFFVKPEFYGLGESKLRSKADTLLKETQAPPAARPSKLIKNRLPGLLKIAFAALAGAGATAVVSAFIH